MNIYRKIKAFIRGYKRKKRYEQLKGLRPLTAETWSDLKVGDTVVTIKRNATVDVIALSCGMVDGADQPANKVVSYTVEYINNLGARCLGKDGDKTPILNPNEKNTLWRGFNLMVVQPHFLSEEFQLRMYYRSNAHV